MKQPNLIIHDASRVEPGTDPATIPPSALSYTIIRTPVMEKLHDGSVRPAINGLGHPIETTTIIPPAATIIPVDVAVPDGTCPVCGTVGTTPTHADDVNKHYLYHCAKCGTDFAAGVNHGG